MRLEQLIYFTKIAEAGSIRSAAESLFVTPQSLSKAVAQLEQELGAALLTRSRVGVSLTAEGHHALEYARDILAQVEKMKQEFGVHAQEKLPNPEPITLFSCSSMETFAMGTINQVMAQDPSATIQIGKMSSAQINQFLVEAETPQLPDLVLTHCSLEEQDSFRARTEARFACYHLFDDVLCVQVPLGDPLAKLDSFPTEKLVDLPLLLYNQVPTEKTLSEIALAKLGAEPRNVSRIANFETTSQVALNLHRYCFVGYPSVEFRPLSGVTYIPLEANLVASQLLLVKRKRKNIALSDAFVRNMGEYYDMKKLW